MSCLIKKIYQGGIMFLSKLKPSVNLIYGTIVLAFFMGPVLLYELYHYHQKKRFMNLSFDQKIHYLRNNGYTGDRPLYANYTKVDYEEQKKQINASSGYKKFFKISQINLKITLDRLFERKKIIGTAIIYNCGENRYLKYRFVNGKEHEINEFSKGVSDDILLTLYLITIVG